MGVDQPAFRRALWESTLSFYVLSSEWNCRTIYPGRLVGQARILHGRHADPERLAAALNARPGIRLFLGFPPQ